jgi:hypothetical protein
MNMRSLRVGRAFPRLVQAHTAFWAGECPTSHQNGCCFMDEARAATWAAEAEREHAKDTHEEEAENSCSEYMVVPGGLPTCGHDANGHQANSEKSVPPTQRLVDRHSRPSLCIDGILDLLIEIHAATRTVASPQPWSVGLAIGSSRLTPQ